MDIASVIQHNRKIQNQLFIRDKELQDIRQELLQAAGIKQDRDSYPVIATGHQPTFYYPGLLFKDFFTGDTTKQTGGRAVNFVVDTDTADLRIPVPCRDQGELNKIRVELKNPDNKIYADFNPSEERIHRFFSSVDRAIKTLSSNAIPEAFNQYREEFFQTWENHPNFSETVTKLRNRFDLILGYSIRDIKVSEMINSHGYYRYILYIIKNLERFTEVYNHAVEQYKRKDYQPVKFLHHKNGWYELPFWVINDSKRYPVHIKKDQGMLQFHSKEAAINITVNTSNKSEEQVIQTLRESITLTPKATSLTMMIRLFIADLFVHGKGGMEYERINNTILHRFFSLDSNLYFYGVTGDIWLPLAGNEMNNHNLEEHFKQKQYWLKEVNRDPERFLPEELSEKYKKEKKQLAKQLKQEADPEKRKTVHNQLMNLNDEMKQHLSSEIERVKETLGRYDQILAKKHTYFERKYPYFLFPPNYLTEKKFKNQLNVRLKPS